MTKQKRAVGRPKSPYLRKNEKLSFRDEAEREKFMDLLTPRKRVEYALAYLELIAAGEVDGMKRLTVKLTKRCDWGERVGEIGDTFRVHYSAIAGCYIVADGDGTDFVYLIPVSDCEVMR